MSDWAPGMPLYRGASMPFDDVLSDGWAIPPAVDRTIAVVVVGVVVGFVLGVAAVVRKALR